MILYYIQRMEKRDKWRTIGGTVRSIVGLIPIILLVVSTWYLYEHGDDLIKNITQIMTQQMTSFMPSQQDIQNMLSRPPAQ